ncbi:hypothetical protein M407DRAFT_240410 [Tulasnella calospora MUT 4182]|uniref:Uncharacterized protein n=1 Tax=Tulasnella calospora MUT 4182 TaxID=1051891 RepID=A0A0C3LK78_9AGAM|nr:hypothetical protein M407DRAFT_240410 [Tulasnella calospora MUT 4182]
MSAARALKRLASDWPKDPIRPHLQFGELLEYIAESTPGDKISARTIGAVKALEGNELMKKYSIPPNMRAPASFPQHYDRLILSHKNALLGKKRSFLQVLFGIYK